MRGDERWYPPPIIAHNVRTMRAKILSRFLARDRSPKPNGVLTLSYYYFLSVIGWALSLLAVAEFSGLVKSN
jgi:hypothetical protein